MTRQVVSYLKRRVPSGEVLGEGYEDLLVQGVHRRHEVGKLKLFGLGCLDGQAEGQRGQDE